MANPLIGQILGSVLGRSMGGSAPGAGVGGMGSGAGGMPGGLGAILGGLTGLGVPGGGSGGGLAGTSARGTGGLGGRNAMLAMMVPLVLQWVQRSGGIGSVLQRVNQHGYGGHADSWIGTGTNEALPPDAAQQLLGRDELANLSSQLGVGQHEVAEGFSEILPEVVDRLSPDGHVPADADSTLDAGQSALQRMLGGMR